MRYHINLAFHLWFLDQLPIRTHALLGKRLAELVGDEGGGVEPGKGNELPAVAEGAQPGNVRFLFGAGHGRFPVEGGGEVVGESGEQKISAVFGIS